MSKYTSQGQSVSINLVLAIEIIQTFEFDFMFFAKTLFYILANPVIWCLFLS